MKTPEEFKADVYRKREARAAARKKRQKLAAVFCVPAVLLTTFLGIRLLAPIETAPSALCLQVTAPEAPQELSLANLNMEENFDDDKWDETVALRKENALEKDFPNAVNGFARNSAAVLAPEFEENACFSPLSLYYALSLTGMGATGETEQEFLEVLGAPSREWLADQCGKFYRLHYRDNDYNKFLLANSLWMQRDFSFCRDFLSTAEEDFYSALFRADFSDPALADEVSRWISDNTGGLLSPELKFEEDTRLAIVNTVYLKDSWTDEFLEEDNTEEPFHKEDGSAITAEFMHRTDMTGDVLRGNGFTRASLPLRDSGEMVFILPDEGVSVQELLTDPHAFEEMFFPKDWEDLTSCQVQWSIPKFSFDAEYDLLEALAKLGLNTATDALSADFSRMSPNSLFISGASQGVHIGADEEGIEAAAYTMIYMECGAAIGSEEIVEMNLNRPFLFAILSEDQLKASDDESPFGGTLLFVGICGAPTEKK